MSMDYQNKQSRRQIKVVEAALEEQEKEADETPSSKKRRKYTPTFSPEDRDQIRKFAVENGNAGAVRKYSVGESTVRLFKKNEVPCCLKLA